MKSSTRLTPYSEFFGWPAFDHFRRQMDRYFLDLPGRKFFPVAEPFERFFTSFSTVPAVDLVEKENEYSICDEKKDEPEEKDKNYGFSERRYGAFRRAFRVTEGVDTDKITARFDVLTISLPKSQTAKAAEKKINITSK
jgi:HSP20 family protein